MQIRHNLVVGEKPFFRRGGCVAKTAYHLEKDENIGFLDEAVAGSDQHWQVWRLSVAVCAALWPHAREAGAILAAQDDPAALSDIQINSALRSNPALVADKHRGRRSQPGDADLANSFVELARDKGVAAQRRSVEARQRCRHRRELAVPFRQTLCHRSRHRQRRRCREPVGHGRRRSLRVRRHQGRGARGQASGDWARRPIIWCSVWRPPGLAVTAATYVSVGGAAPVRAGLDAGQGRPQGRAARRGARRMGRPLGARCRRCAACCRRRWPPGSVLRPGQTISAIKAAFRAEKAGALVRLGKDVGRVGEKAGTRGALDTLRIARGPEGCRARGAACGSARAARPARS